MIELPSIESNIQAVQGLDDQLKNGPNVLAPPLPRDIADALEHAARLPVSQERGRAILRLHRLYTRSLSEPNVALSVQKELNKLLGLYEPTTQQLKEDCIPIDTVRERWELGVSMLRQAIETAIDAALVKLRTAKSDKTRRKALGCILSAIDDVLAQPGTNGEQ